MVSNLPANKHVIFSYTVFSRNLGNEYLPYYLFEISKTISNFILKSIGLGCMNSTLVSYANNIGIGSLFITLVSQIYVTEIEVVPRWNRVAHRV
jgi:hypothetical protein